MIKGGWVHGMPDHVWCTHCNLISLNPINVVQYSSTMATLIMMGLDNSCEVSRI